MWAAETHLRILGKTFGVQVTESADGDVLREILGSFLLSRSTGVPARRRFALVRDGEDRVVAYRDCRRLGTPADLEAALHRLVAALNRASIEEFQGFAVHAGVVARHNGTVAFPVHSGGGKSTLTAACLLSGFDYVSDEALCFDLEGSVLPYPKPLALDRRAFDLLGLTAAAATVPSRGSEALATAADLHAVVAAPPLELRHLVLPTFGHEKTVLEEVAPSEAMAALLSFSFNHYKLGEVAFHLAATLASNLEGAWHLSYDDPREAAEELARRLL